jgi:hypothetical protein
MCPHRDGEVDLLAGVHLQEVDVQDQRLDRVVLHLADQGGGRLAPLDLQVDERVRRAGREKPLQLVDGDLERARLVAVAVDHRGDVPLAAELAGGVLPEGGAIAGVERDSHLDLPWVYPFVSITRRAS